MLKGSGGEEPDLFSQDTLSHTMTCSNSKAQTGELKDDGGRDSPDIEDIDERPGDEDKEEGARLAQTPLDIENQFTFLQSICYKQSQHFDKSQAQYKKLEEIFKSRQGFKLAKCVLTNLMLPMQVNRKIVENYVQLFLESVQITNKDAYWDADRDLRLNSLLHYKTNQWEDEQKGIEFISNLPLFKRLKSNSYSY